MGEIEKTGLVKEEWFIRYPGNSPGTGKGWHGPRPKAWRSWPCSRRFRPRRCGCLPDRVFGLSLQMGTLIPNGSRQKIDRFFCPYHLVIHVAKMGSDSSYCPCLFTFTAPFLISSFKAVLKVVCPISYSAR